MVNAGESDVAIFAGGESSSAVTSSLASEWGPGSEHAAAGDQRWFGAAGWGTDFLALNPTRPALKDPDVRRAVSLALDRRALANIWVTAPSAYLVIPSVRGGPEIDVSP